MADVQITLYPEDIKEAIAGYIESVWGSFDGNMKLEIKIKQDNDTLAFDTLIAVCDIKQ